ncbi:MAG: hypothetical protein WCR71_00150 [Bacteroidales bacterium]
MSKARKFGAFGGVFTPSILTLVGVIMYLRLPWIIGQAGLLATLGIILVAHIVSGSTGLSVASIATDKRVETGGTYYIISRSLGLPIGGTLGWALFAGLSLSVSLYLIGFAEVFLGYFGFAATLDNIRILGSVMLLLITILTFISTSLTIKTQYIILTIMVLSVLSVFLGKHEFGPTLPQIKSLPGALPWITLFAIFFPAVTGFEAGVAMSGDLKDARKDIPRGVIASILAALLVYVALSFFLSFTVESEMLVSDPNVLFKISLVPQLVIAGVLGATLSSALGSILGAPRILQAVAKDRIAPSFLGKGFGASHEPRNALLFTFLIAQAGILIGELNVIARVVTIFFIITYGFINITYAVESWASSDFRPSFKIPRIVSIIGALACIIIMIQLDILALAVAAAILIVLFLYLKNKELTLNAGDTRSSLQLSLVKTGLESLAKSDEKSRNWRPNIIVFSGGVSKRPYLVKLAKNLVGKLGIFTNFELIVDDKEGEPKKEINPLMDSTAQILFEKLSDNTEVLTRRHHCSNLYEGIGLISSVYGFSGFEPNTVLMGWPKNLKENRSFEALLTSLSKQDYNLAFLKYDKSKGFGDHKSIDVWWDGEGNSLPLALHFLRFITATIEWRNAQVRIMLINNSIKNRDRFYSVICDLLDSYRIKAQVKIINNVERVPEAKIFKAESLNTDLTLAQIPSLTKVPEFGTTLFIKADSSFDQVISMSNLKGSSTNDSAEILELSESSFSKVQLPEEEPIRTKFSNLAGRLEVISQIFLRDTIDNIEQERDIFIDFLVEKLSTANEELSKNADFSDRIRFAEYIQSLLDDFKANSLKAQIKQLEQGIDKYLKETNLAIKKLPSAVKITYSKEDFQKQRARTPVQKINRALKLARLNLSKKDVTIRVKLHAAAHYFLYYKRVKAIELFYEHFTAESLSFFAAVRELENYFYDPSQKSAVLNSLTEVQELNRAFVKNYEYKIVAEVVFDFNNFVKFLRNPQANILSTHFKPFANKSSLIRQELREFPELYEKFMINHVNKTKLDFIYIALKEKLATSVNHAQDSIKTKLNSTLLKFLDEFEQIILGTKDEGKFVSITKPVIMPSLDICFSLLQNEIEDALNTLDESITIGGEDLPEKFTLTSLEEMDEYVISPRKIADFYISNDLREIISKQSFELIEIVTESVITVRNLVKLVNFALSVGEENSDSSAEVTLEKREALIESLRKNLSKERVKVTKAMQAVNTHLNEGLKKSFEPLASAVISKTSANIHKKLLESEHKSLIGKIIELKKVYVKSISDKFVSLLYHQSEGLLWVNRLDKGPFRKSLYSSDNVSDMLEKSSPNKEILELLPFYYLNLFTGRSGVGEDFWIGMEEESNKGKQAINRFLNGSKGLLIIAGERRSGKSSLSKHLANIHFLGSNTFYVRAPRESDANVELFEKTLYETIIRDSHHDNYPNHYTSKESLESLLAQLDGKCIIVINDMELWWERRPGGTVVVERIIELMQQFGREILFVVNVNRHALKIINYLSNLSTWAIDVIMCSPFPAKNLKEFIVARHKAGGLKFVLNNKLEEQMTNWDYAHLFNHIFNLSGGNPGYAINLWLGSIKNISGDTIFMERPKGITDCFAKELNNEDAVYILQFVLHRRFSTNHLAQILQLDLEIVKTKVRILFQKGILVEKYPAIYSLNPMLVPQLIKRLQEMELL